MFCHFFVGISNALRVDAGWISIILNPSFMIFSDFYSVKSIPILMFLLILTLFIYLLIIDCYSDELIFALRV